MNGLTIEIIKDEEISTAKTEYFTLKVNGEVIMECMTKREVEDFTIKGITEIWRQVV